MKRTIFLAAALSVAASVFGFAADNGLAPVGSSVYTASDLVWHDEFDGSSLNMNDWNFEFHQPGWVNSELQSYDDSPKNTYVKDGCLVIQPLKTGNKYTSGRVNTMNKRNFKYGRFEARLKVPKGQGFLPAFWMMPANEGLYGQWPKCGEIDIMEVLGHQTNTQYATLHFGEPHTMKQKTYNSKGKDFASDFHVFACEWEPGEIRWYVDDTLYSTQTDWNSAGHAYPAPFDQNFYLILNLAVGGHFDGVDGIHAEPATFADGEKQFQIDYVRVYDLGDAFAPTPVTSLPLELYLEQADASLENKDGETVIRITDPGAKEYSVMGLIRGKQVHAGETHTLSFDVSGSQAREMIVTVEDGTYTRYLDKRVTVTGEDTHYSFDVTFDADMTADLKFQLGDLTDTAGIPAHTVTLRNIQWE